MQEYIHHTPDNDEYEQTMEEWAAAGFFAAANTTEADASQEEESTKLISVTLRLAVDAAAKIKRLYEAGALSHIPSLGEIVDIQ